MGTTKKPTGMSISRKDNKFTCSWKRPETYADQQCYYRVKRGDKWGHWNSSHTKFLDGWDKLSCGDSAKSKSIELTLSRYYPNKSGGSYKKQLNGIQFKVRGKHSGDKWSDYTYETYTINPPSAPTSLTQSLNDGTTNAATFTWTGKASDTAHAYYTETFWQTRLLKDSDISEGKKAFDTTAVSGTVDSGTSTLNSSKSITETTGTIEDGHSYTRWFRICKRGPSGRSDWRYAKHVYAATNRSEDVVASAEVNDAGGYDVAMSWTTSTSGGARPIDSIMAQYVVAEPAAGLNCPAGLTWTDAKASKYKNGNDGSVYSVDGSLTDNKCLFTRVNTIHDGQTTEGVPVLTKIGTLSTPTGVSVTDINNTQHTITVSATNTAVGSVSDAYMAVIFQGDNYPQTVIGIIPAGQSSISPLKCPNWDSMNSYAIGVYGVVGVATYGTGSNGVKKYSINPFPGKPGIMTSETTWWLNGSVPKAPATVTVKQPDSIDSLGTLQVNWSWTWQDADGAEISWSKNPDAWESTDEPSVYNAPRVNSGQWFITGLDTNVKWYVKVRLTKNVDNEVVKGPYTSGNNGAPVIIRTVPDTPKLTLSESIVRIDGHFTASWDYVCADESAQQYAEVREVTITGSGITYGNVIGHTTSEQGITLYPSALATPWTAGSVHNLCVKVVSENGYQSKWSAPTPIRVAVPLTCAVTYPSGDGATLKTITIEDDTDTHTTRQVLSLIDMPLTLTCTGAGTLGTTTVAIERAESYYLDRPDERWIPSHEGEVVALVTQTGEETITIDNDDLIGTLDDGAVYRIVATVSDSLGQRDELDPPIIFEVHWNEQAKEPGGTVTIDTTNNVAMITPTATNPGEGATCDIYRLSVDRPVLVYANAEFGTTYVDPFPTIGENGGHRLVYKTENGDYTTQNGGIAWLNLGAAQGDVLDIKNAIIDFGGDQVQLTYNLDLSYSWEKDFKETKYLGGSVRGDWNPAVTRTGTINSFSITTKDQDVIQAMRRLADYAGICHVRTPDGSSFPANVEVSDGRNYDEAHKAASFSLTITRVDPEGFDGQTYADWINS